MLCILGFYPLLLMRIEEGIHVNVVMKVWPVLECKISYWRVWLDAYSVRVVEFLMPKCFEESTWRR